jgi:hypothetical protein
MASFASDDSVASTPTMDTEDGTSISETLSCMGNGKRRATPFDKLRELSFKDDDAMESIIDELVSYNDGLASNEFCQYRALTMKNKDKAACMS